MLLTFHSAILIFYFRRRKAFNLQASFFEAYMKMYNFNSGPAVLPAEVLQQASEAVINFNDLGLSILEIGHRTDWFMQVWKKQNR